VRLKIIPRILCALLLYMEVNTEIYRAATKTKKENIKNKKIDSNGLIDIIDGPIRRMNKDIKRAIENLSFPFSFSILNFPIKTAIEIVNTAINIPRKKRLSGFSVILFRFFL